MAELIEDPDGAPYPQEVQDFYTEYCEPYFNDMFLGEARGELVKALESVASFWRDANA